MLVKKWLKFKQGLDKVLELERLSGQALTLDLRKIAGLGVNVTELYLYARLLPQRVFQRH